MAGAADHLGGATKHNLACELNMASTTELRPDDKMARAFAVSRRVQIDSVRLKASASRLSVEGEKIPTHIEVRHSTKTAKDKKSNVVRVLVQCEFVATYDGATAAPDKSPVYILAMFDVAYSLQGDGEPSSAELDAFGELNGMYNTWPYWREFTQSTLCRMGLPPYTLPVLPPTQPKQSKQSAHPSPPTDGPPKKRTNKRGVKKK